MLGPRGCLVSLAIASIGLLVGCTRLVPEWQFDRDLDLSDRETYAIQPATTPSGLDVADQRLWKHRRSLVASLIRDELRTRGFRESGDAPDFEVKFFVRERESDSLVHQDGERQGKLDIILIDPPSGTWLWHGWASETIVYGLDEDEELREAVPLIFSKLPPKGGAADRSR